MPDKEAAGLEELKRMISAAKRDATAARLNHKQKEYERRGTTDSREDKRQKRVRKNIYWETIAERVGLYKGLAEPNDLINVYNYAFTIAAFLVSHEVIGSSEQYEKCFKIVRRLMRCVTNHFIDMQIRSVDWKMKPIDYIMADRSETPYNGR